MARSRPANTTSPNRQKQKALPPPAIVHREAPPVLRAIIEETRGRAHRAENLAYAARELLVTWPPGIDEDRQWALEVAMDEMGKTGEAVDYLEKLVNDCSWGAELEAVRAAA